MAATATVWPRLFGLAFCTGGAIEEVLGPAFRCGGAAVAGPASRDTVAPALRVGVDVVGALRIGTLSSGRASVRYLIGAGGGVAVCTDGVRVLMTALLIFYLYWDEKRRGACRVGEREMKSQLL